MQRKDIFKVKKLEGAARLKEFRRSLGLNKNQLAKIIGCTIQSIGYYEEGKNWIPSIVCYKLDEIHIGAYGYIAGFRKVPYENLEQLTKAKTKAFEILKSNTIKARIK